MARCDLVEEDPMKGLIRYDLLMKNLIRGKQGQALGDDRQEEQMKAQR